MYDCDIHGTNSNVCNCFGQREDEERARRAEAEATEAKKEAIRRDIDRRYRLSIARNLHQGALALHNGLVEQHGTRPEWTVVRYLADAVGNLIDALEES